VIRAHGAIECSSSSTGRNSIEGDDRFKKKNGKETRRGFKQSAPDMSRREGFTGMAEVPLLENSRTRISD